MNFNPFEDPTHVHSWHNVEDITFDPCVDRDVRLGCACGAETTARLGLLPDGPVQVTHFDLWPNGQNTATPDN